MWYWDLGELPWPAEPALQSHTGYSTSFNLWYHEGSGTWTGAIVTVVD